MALFMLSRFDYLAYIALLFLDHCCSSWLYLVMHCCLFQIVNSLVFKHAILYKTIFGTISGYETNLSMQHFSGLICCICGRVNIKPQVKIRCTFSLFILKSASDCGKKITCNAVSNSKERSLGNPCIPRGYKLTVNASDTQLLVSSMGGNFSACKSEALALLKRRQGSIIFCSFSVMSF